jgi:hypothetical protein
VFARHQHRVGAQRQRTRQRIAQAGGLPSLGHVLHRAHQRGGPATRVARGDGAAHVHHAFFAAGALDAVGDVQAGTAFDQGQALRVQRCPVLGMHQRQHALERQVVAQGHAEDQMGLLGPLDATAAHVQPPGTHARRALHLFQPLLGQAQLLAERLRLALLVSDDPGRVGQTAVADVRSQQLALIGVARDAHEPLAVAAQTSAVEPAQDHGGEQHAGQQHRQHRRPAQVRPAQRHGGRAAATDQGQTERGQQHQRQAQQDAMGFGRGIHEGAQAA